jgi:spermidine synthase
MKRRILFALILMGFTSLVVQALLIREFLITFYGNELTIGIILACWIISEATGSGIASRLSARVKSPFATYAFLQLLIALYLPLSIFLIRGIKNILPVIPGEGVGLVPIVASCFLIIGPLSIFDGMQFPFGCRIYPGRQRGSEQTAGRVYILEAMGFILAGPVFTYLFLVKLNAFQIAFAIGLINLLSGLSLRASLVRQNREKSEAISKNRLPACRQGRLWPFGPRNDIRGNLLSIIITILIFLNLYALLFNITPRLHNFSIANQWKNQHVAAYENSIYGNLAVIQKKEQFTFYSDGIPIINIPTPDIFSTEEFVHFGMLSHPNPKKVLFLGGGAGGFINEALKYPVERIDYAEIDPVLITLLKKFPKDITKKELNNSKVNVKIIDGVRFVRGTNNKYDVVFINLPSPSTLQLNRYYTKEFFDLIKNRLSPNGELVLSLPGSLSYLNEELKQLNLCILNTLKDSFPYVYAIPGDDNIYICSPSSLTISAELFMDRIRQRNIAAAVLTKPHLQYRLRQSWQDWFYETLKKGVPDTGSEVRKNKNLAPAGVFYGISYWNSLFNPSLRKFFKPLNNLKFNHLIFLVIIFALLLFLVIARNPEEDSFICHCEVVEGNRSNLRTGSEQAPQSLKRDCLPAGKAGFAPSRLAMTGVATSITTTGFAGMSLNLIFILSYQIFFGYVYHHIALLVTAFMAGLTLGGWLITRNLARITKGLSCLIAMEVAIIFFCLGSGLFLTYLNGVKAFGFYPIFYILSGLSGLMVGCEFPLANKLYWQDATYIKTAGVLYALDLLGAFCAAILITIILLPIFGILKTCLFLAILKMAGLTLYLPKRTRSVG